MSCVDRTASLAELFDAAVARHREEAAKGSGDRAAHPLRTKVSSGGEEIHSVVGPFLEALAAAQREVVHFEQRAESAIASALWTMDACVTGTLMDLEADLSEACAGFVTLGATLDRLETKIDEALQLVIAAQRKATEADILLKEDDEPSDPATLDGWVERVVKRIATFGSAAEHYLVGPSDTKNLSAPLPPCRDALEHCKCAVDILRAVVVSKKMRLGLCEEELQLFRKDILLLGKCHVVSGAVNEPVDVPSLFSDVSRGSASVRAEATVKHTSTVDEPTDDVVAGRQLGVIPKRKDTRGEEGARRDDGSPTVAASAAASQQQDGTTSRDHVGSSSRVSVLRDRARQSLQRVVKTTTSAITRNALAANPRSVAAALAGAVHSSLSSRAESSALVDGDEHLGPVGDQYWSRFTVPEDERPNMEAELVVLEQQLTESSARAAREIEGAVRELSQLTSMLNEKAIAQAEQLSLVLKNTDDAHSNVQKAATQLQRASQAGFWNASRQLIALLWFCTLLVLAAHVVIR